jgi:hypothetical protein
VSFCPGTAGSWFPNAPQGRYEFEGPTLRTTASDTFSGYELDSLIPFTAYLGLGLAAALLYAAKRATRRQHRGLSLTSMAAGVAASGLALSFLIDAPGIVETGSDSDIGIYVALIGALVWTVGSFLLANEPEGDIEHDDHHSTTRTDSGRSTSSN